MSLIPTLRDRSIPVNEPANRYWYDQLILTILKVVIARIGAHIEIAMVCGEAAVMSSFKLRSQTFDKAIGQKLSHHLTSLGCEVDRISEIDLIRLDMAGRIGEHRARLSGDTPHDLFTLWKPV